MAVVAWGGRNGHDPTKLIRISSAPRSFVSGKKVLLFFTLGVGRKHRASEIPVPGVSP